MYRSRPDYPGDCPKTPDTRQTSVQHRPEHPNPPRCSNYICCRGKYQEERVPLLPEQVYPGPAFARSRGLKDSGEDLGIAGNIPACNFACVTPPFDCTPMWYFRGLKDSGKNLGIAGNIPACNFACVTPPFDSMKFGASAVSPTAKNSGTRL